MTPETPEAPLAAQGSGQGLSAPRIGPDDLVDAFDPRPVVEREVPFHGAIWDVRRDTVDLGEGGRVTREYLEHPGAVVVVPYREVEARPEILMIRQYRHPVGVFEWELPAGLLDVDGEEPDVAAARELAEEVDLTAETWHTLVDFYSSPGGLTEALRVYLARDLGEVPADERHEREAEELGMPSAWVDLDVARDAVLGGRVNNAGAVVGILATCTARAQGWSTLRDATTPWPQHPRNRPR